MRITMETDYAIRIVYCLAKNSAVMDAKEICSQVGVTFRFALKILRKLCMAGIVRSFRGVKGGYSLLLPPGEITLLKIFEATDGDMAVSRCLKKDEPCAWSEDGLPCPFHDDFRDLNNLIKRKLESINFRDVLIR